MAEKAIQRLGVIAGFGRFPFLVVEGARRSGCHVTVIGLRGLADPGLAERADAFHWAGLARLGRWVRLLRRARAQGVVLAGAVKKSAMYGRWRMLHYLPDWTSIRLWFFSLRDKRNDSVLSAVADVFNRNGMPVQDCTRYTPEQLAPEGVLSDRQPSTAQWKDITFGWPIAREMGRLDIGQSIAVKEQEIIAVEAIEGTDRMIERAGALCPRGGWVLIKVAKPHQDMRFDVPTVGPATVAHLARHGASALVIEAHKTLIVDREIMLDDARRAGLVIVSRSGNAPQPPGS